MTDASQAVPPQGMGMRWMSALVSYIFPAGGKRLREKACARDKGNRQGLVKYFSRKVSFGQEAELLREMETANVGGRSKGFRADIGFRRNKATFPL